MKQRIVNFV